MFHAQAPDQKNLKDIAPTELQIGMYVILNCSWFVHPFPTTSFVLSSTSQIQTIRGLGLKSVTVDLAKSDPAAVQTLSKTASPAPEQASAPGQPTSTAQPGADSAAVEPKPVTPPSPMEQYLKGLQKADQALTRHVQNSARFMKELSSGAPEGFSNMKQIVRDLGNMIGDDGSTGAIVNILNPEECAEISTIHALTVCALSMILGRHLKLDPDKLKALGMGALYHDAGEGKLPVTIRKAQGPLTVEQRRQFEEHPLFGVKLAAKDPGFPALGLTVIQEHHERLDGSGYPFGLKGNKLSFPSQIVMVLDEYDELINRQDSSRALRPAEALAYLQTKRQQALNKDIIAALVETLGVYPPGSIVQLSDGAAALVLSLGEPDRMRPMVVVHDGPASQDKPHIVDLASDSSLAITRAIPKQDIPLDTAQYLDFKHWAGYFVKSMQSVVEAALAELPKAA